MCGISGIYTWNGSPIQAGEIAAQIETLVHRGPDEEGCYLSSLGNCGLGIRRLSIIDVAGGHQPLHNETSMIHLVYNGETYNHRDLRCELECLGHRPASGSDGEVVLHGYEAWGAEGMLARLRGMFALALWDEPGQQLFLARDRFGVKPLYYARHGSRLYFASEIKAILADPTFPRRVNLAALQAMLTVGFVPGPATMFEGIEKLPPAHYLIAREGRLTIRPYWRLTYPEPLDLSLNEAVEQFLALLQESIRLRLMSEVPLGALLSGGLDSGMLMALLQAGLEQSQAETADFTVPLGLPLRTISIGFDEPGYDEAPLAYSLARYIGTEHHPVTCTGRDFEDYPAAMRHLEEPQCSATALPIYRLYQACRQAGLTVVLTGEGADELLGGYHWHKGDAVMRPLLGLPADLRRLLARLPLPMSQAARRVLGRGATDLPTRYRHWLEVPDAGYRTRLLAAAAQDELSREEENPLLAAWPALLTGLQTRVPLHQALGLEAQTRLADFINFEVDKMSMAHSVEARVPFLDHRLWEFCAALPARYKLNGRVEKYLLRRAARHLLPEPTWTRAKKGLAAPYAHWLQAERLPEWAETVLAPDAIQRAGLFEPAAVRELRRAHRAGRPSLGSLLMGVLSTQLWFELFVR